MVVLSIIIPTYNAAATLRTCLTSALSQSFKSTEVLVLDGGSTDGTVNILKEFAASYNNLKWVSDSDKGIYDAMNKGIRLAKGEWIYFIGCDDKLYNTYVLDSLASYFSDKTIDVLYGDVIMTSSPTRYAGEFNLDRLLYSQNICHQAVFYRRGVFEKVGLYNLRYNIWGDWEFNIRCFRHTELSINYVDVIVALYNDESGVSGVEDEIFRKEIPVFYINKIRLLEAQNLNLLSSESFLLGNKLIKALKTIGIGKLLK